MRSKNIFFGTLFLLLTAFSVHAQSYIISSVDFSASGLTKNSALRRNIRIEEGKTFSSKKELEAYIVDIKQKLINARLFETAEVTYEEGSGSDGIPVSISVRTVDSRHFLLLPYPKYDSNEGFELKIKIKDDNFLGLMSPLSGDVSALFENKPNQSRDFVAGASIKYDLPFNIGRIESSWNNDLAFKYAFVRGEPEWNLRTGLSFLLPFKRAGVRLDLTQGFVRNLDYTDFDDHLYFTENAKLSLPIILESIENFGDIVYTPAAEVVCNWDANGINKTDEDLLSPKLIFSHSLSAGRVNWIGNFRKGFTASITQSAAYHFELKEFQPGIEVKVNAFYAWKYAGLNARYTLFAEHNTFRRFGSIVRGLPDDTYFSDSGISPNNYQEKAAAAMVLNMDLPIHIFSTDWEKWGWNWAKSLNFEVQLTPFIDIALANNRMTGRVFDPRDGFYTAGLEVLVFPQKWRSIVVRASAGFDLGRILLKDWIDTSWRDEKAGKTEITVGIGLFY